MKIVITEEQYSKLNQYIIEQGFGGAAGIVGAPQDYSQRNSQPISKQFSCLSDISLVPFIYYVKKNKNNICKKLGITTDLLLTFTKAAIGIMKRESDYGKSVTAVGEKLLDWFDDTFLNKSLKKRGTIGSVGPAQFRYQTWRDLGMEKMFNMDRNSMRQITGAGLGTISSLVNNYRKAISAGYSNNTRSVNPFLKKKGINFLSTNNAALDMAIVSHNMEIIKKYCYTSSPILAGPCDEPIYEPYEKGSDNYKKFGTLKVYQNKPIKDYFPNKGFNKQTAIGYLEEVVRVINSLNCIKL